MKLFQLYSKQAMHMFGFAGLVLAPIAHIVAVTFFSWLEGENSLLVLGLFLLSFPLGFAAGMGLCIAICLCFVFSPIVLIYIILRIVRGK